MIVQITKYALITGLVTFACYEAATYKSSEKEKRVAEAFTSNSKTTYSDVIRSAVTKTGKPIYLLNKKELDEFVKTSKDSKP